MALIITLMGRSGRHNWGGPVKVIPEMIILIIWWGGLGLILKDLYLLDPALEVQLGGQC
jgi:hypothetical protein